ncbi:MAG: FHIPEP family type III secretion protein, partial [Gammaproteobacteria bacterium]|nr:FHIPEP family type III secretion protein [Gammaproteobacteria bacterium]
VDATTVVATHLSHVVQLHAHELLGHEEVQQLLNAVARSTPKLVEDLVPKTLSLGQVVRVVQNLLLEHVPIRDFRTIAEALAEQSAISQETDALTGAVRVALRRTIVQQINGIARDLPIITLDARLEQLLHQSLRGDSGGAPSIEPGLAERLQQALAQCLNRQELQGEPTVLVVAPGIRTWLAKLYLPALPGLHVLGYTEIPETKQVRIVHTIGEDVLQATMASAA